MAKALDSLEALDEIERRCSEAKLECRISRPTEESRGSFRVTFPVGREARVRAYSTSHARAFADAKFEDFCFLGNYEALFDPDQNVIEAHLVRLQSGGPVHGYVLNHYVHWPETSDDGAGEVVTEDDGDLRRSEPKYSPQRYSRGERWLEIGPASPVFIAAFGKTRGFTLRLPFGSEFRHDEALTHLERVANAFFFDFDMRYGFSIGLAVEQRRWRRSSRRYDGDPEYPANVYAQEPLALLRYGALHK